MINSAIRERILETEAFTQIRDLHSLKGRAFSEIEQKYFDLAALDIMEAIGDSLKNRKDLADKRDPGITGKTLKVIFHETTKNTTHESRIKKLKILLFYAGIDDEEWDSYLRPKNKQDIKLNGYWYVYRFDDDGLELKRTVLHISNAKENHTISFRSLYNKFDNGILAVHSSFLTITFIHHNDTKSIEISTQMPEKADKITVLSGVIRSTIQDDSSTTAKNCILYHSENQHQNISTDEIWTVVHSSKRSSNNEFHNNVSFDIEDAMLEFLTQHKVHVLAHAFVPPSVQQLKKINEPFIDKFKNVKGRYFAIIPNERKKGSFYLITIEIDLLGNVVEQICVETDDTKTIISYNGSATVWQNIMRLSNSTYKLQKSEYLFEINVAQLEEHKIMKGITMDTDSYGHPCADACIAIKYEVFCQVIKDSNSIIPFEPSDLKIDDTCFPAINRHVKEKLNISLDDYFAVHKSIRWR